MIVRLAHARGEVGLLALQGLDLLRQGVELTLLLVAEFGAQLAHLGRGRGRRNLRSGWFPRGTGRGRAAALLQPIAVAADVFAPKASPSAATVCVTTLSRKRR